MSGRTYWATRPAPGMPLTRHQSKKATFEYVRRQAALHRDGALRPPRLQVLCRSSEVQNWDCYEWIDLTEVEPPSQGITSTATTPDSGAALLPGHVRVIPRGKLP